MFVPYGRILSLDAYRGDAADPSVHRRQALVAQPRGRMGSPRPARRGPTRLPRAHRQRPRHRHGDVRLGLPARAVDLRARRVRAPATGCGRRATRRSTSSTTCSSTSATSRSDRPVPAYRHDAAMFFELRGWASSDATPPGAPRRPESDRAVLADIAARLDALPVRITQVKKLSTARGFLAHLDGLGIKHPRRRGGRS